jgi:ATP synthase protein I
MTGDDARDSLRDLGKRLEGAQRELDGAAGKSGGGIGSSGSALAFAWRVSIELVGAIAIATALGWALDRWLGTRPWGMIVLFFLGVAAGMVNVWRTVKGLTGAVGYRHEGAAEAAEDQGDDEE